MQRLGVTQRNLQVLQALRDIQTETGGYPPTVREIGARLGLASPSTVQNHINRLAAAGLVERRGKRRVVTCQGLSVLNRLAA